MNNEIRKFFENISEILRKSSGTVDMIFTIGTSALSEKSSEWINDGSSNMSEIYILLKDIGDIVRNYQNYGESQESFFEDLYAIIQDLSYHAVIFGIYFDSIENVFQNEILKNNISEINQTTKEIIKEETQLLQNILSKVDTAKNAFEKVFSREELDYSYRLSYLYDLQRSLLSLQIIACDLKKGWWLKGE